MVMGGLMTVRLITACLCRTLSCGGIPRPSPLPRARSFPTPNSATPFIDYLSSRHQAALNYHDLWPQLYPSLWFVTTLLTWIFSALGEEPWHQRSSGTCFRFCHQPNPESRTPNQPLLLPSLLLCPVDTLILADSVSDPVC